MHPAEFKTLREPVGLSISTLVNVANVEEPISCTSESGKKHPPQGVVDSLEAIESLLNKTAAEIVAQHQESMKDGGEQGVVLERFTKSEDLAAAYPAFAELPTTTFAVVLFRVRQKFIDLGVPVSIIYKKA